MKDKDIENLLNQEFEEDERPEDRLILQPDGSRACISYELSGKGFHLENDKRGLRGYSHRN